MSETKALKFSWDEVSQKLQPEIEGILGRRILCVAKPDDEYYWCVAFPEGRIPLSDLFKILEAINASERERIDSVPPERDHPVDVAALVCRPVNCCFVAASDINGKPYTSKMMHCGFSVRRTVI